MPIYKIIFALPTLWLAKRHPIIIWLWKAKPFAWYNVLLRLILLAMCKRRSTTIAGGNKLVAAPIAEHSQMDQPLPPFMTAASLLMEAGGSSS